MNIFFKKMFGMRRNAFLVPTCLVLGFLHANLASAQDRVKNGTLTEPESSQKIMTDAKGKKIQVVDFNDAQIEGKAKAPDGFVLQSRQGAGFKNIMELRRNFRNQIESSSFEALVAAPAAQ